MFMVNTKPYVCFKLKPSRFQRGFQLFFALVISILLLNLLSLLMSVFAVVLLCVSAYFMHKQAKIEQLEQLDVDIWSVKMTRNTHIQQVKIKQIIDHLFYIVIYVEDTQNLNHRLNLIIWHDQCDLKHWKMLKTQAKLG